MKQDM